MIRDGVMGGVDARVAGVGGVVMLLPDMWAVVELADDDERRRSVGALVERQLGKVDSWASLRRTLTQQLLEQTARAAKSRGQFMAVSLMEAGGMPVPASVTVHTLPGEDFEELGKSLIAEATRQGAEAGQAVGLTEGEFGVILRRVRSGVVRTEVGSLVGEASDQVIESFVVDYWVEPTGSADLVYLAFASPLVGARDALLGLFDVIAGSVHVVAGTPED